MIHSPASDDRPRRVRFEVGDDRVGVLTLDRPEKRNAMDDAMFAALHDAAARARTAVADRSCRAVLMHGEGPVFSAGTDLSTLGEQRDGPPDDAHIAWLQQAFTAWEDLDVPVVAAVSGVAYGAGCQLALAAHLRLASPDARFGLLETRWGILPDLGASYRLPPLVGRSRAVDMAVRARIVDAATAHAWGLVDEVVEGDLLQAARAYVAEIAAGPVLATGRAARLMREAAGRPRAEALAAERAGQRRVLRSADFAEAVRAGTEGESPQYRGR